MRSANAENVGMKKRIVHEIQRLVMIFAYLALFFLSSGFTPDWCCPNTKSITSNMG
jgi:hypothetical protein